MRIQWVSWCVIAASVFLLGACDKSAPTPAKDQAEKVEAAAEVVTGWEAHIADYPKRWIAAEAPLYIRFTHPVVGAEQVNTAFDPKLIAFDTKVPFNLTFTSPTDLRIQPAERLPSDTAIRVRLRAKGLQGVDESLDDFAFEVRTIKQAFDLKVNSLQVAEDNEEQMQLSGVVVTADTAELGDVKKILSVQVNGNIIEPVWTQELDKKAHNFLITGITRGDANGKIQINWDGAALGSSDKGAREIDIPAKKLFQVTGVQVIRQPNAAIEIHFSDELDAYQNINGLINLGGKPVNAVVDGSVIRHNLEEVPTGELELLVNAAVSNAKRKTLGNNYQQKIVLELVKPVVRFVGKTSILPPASQISVPFEAAGVGFVQVSAF